MPLNSEHPISPPGFQETENLFNSLCSTLYQKPDRKRPLLIMGDRGSGKTVLVKKVSRWHSNVFPQNNREQLNLASIPETLVESALFGHAAGAFTGAIKDYPGVFERLKKDGDLLILEELGEISKPIQSKLLTVIEDGKFTKIGAKEMTAKNIFIFATTNREKPQGLKDDIFRQDFFDRFFSFSTSPLHARRKDILHYLREEMETAMIDLSRYDILALMAHKWPGNVRGVGKYADAFKWFMELKKGNLGGFTPHQMAVTHEWQHDFGTISKVEKLEGNLNRFNLSLHDKTTKAFSQIPTDKDMDRAYQGLELFCRQTGQDITADYNLLNLKPDNTEEGMSFDITSLKFEELKQLYFSRLLAETHGNKQEVARRSGINARTIYDQYK
jgi:DNA-binding NtrC family response regulator